MLPAYYFDCRVSLIGGVDNSAAQVGAFAVIH